MKTTILAGLLFLVGCGGGGIDNDSSNVTVSACEAVGGSCVAVYPGTCANGHSIGNCGTGVGAFCCVPDKQPEACVALPDWNGSANPSAQYCEAMGYKYSTVDGSCTFPDQTACEGWAFFRGECGQTRSFCARQGGTVAATSHDAGGWTAVAATCTLPDGKVCDEQAFSHSCACK